MIVKLSDGTQEVLLRDVSEAVCRCGRTLTWEYLDAFHAQLSATAEYECGMVYTAWLATVKVEGLDRNAYV